MKKITLYAAALVAAFTLANYAGAVEQPFSPKADMRHPVIQSGSHADPDLVHGQPQLGKAIPVVKLASGSSENDPDTLAMIKSCSLSPRLKGDSAPCKACCKTAMK